MMSVHHPHPEHREALIDSMHRFEAALDGQPGLISMPTLADGDTDRLVGLAIFESREACASIIHAATRVAPATGPGVAEWIDQVRLDGTPQILAFDTHVSGSSGSAAKAIRRRLRTRRIDARVGTGFLVAGEPPTLRPGETERATAWGAQLARA